MGSWENTRVALGGFPMQLPCFPNSPRVFMRLYYTEKRYIFLNWYTLHLEVPEDNQLFIYGAWPRIWNSDCQWNTERRRERNSDSNRLESLYHSSATLPLWVHMQWTVMGLGEEFKKGPGWKCGHPYRLWKRASPQSHLPTSEVLYPPVDFPTAPIRTAGMTITKQPKEPANESMRALVELLLDRTRWKYTCHGIPPNIYETTRKTDRPRAINGSYTINCRFISFEYPEHVEFMCSPFSTFT